MAAFACQAAILSLIILLQEIIILELGYYNTKQKILCLQKIISISISRPFYETILFWVLISAAITALLVWKFNQTKLKKQKRLIEQQAALMKERNRITSDLHDDVGSSLSSLQIHSVIAKQLIDSDADKAKDYLDKIINQSSDINSNISDIIWSMKSQEDRLVDMDGRIRNLVSNLLGATNINYSIDIANPLEDVSAKYYCKKKYYAHNKRSLKQLRQIQPCNGVYIICTI